MKRHRYETICREIVPKSNMPMSPLKHHRHEHVTALDNARKVIEAGGNVVGSRRYRHTRQCRQRITGTQRQRLPVKLNDLRLIIAGTGGQSVALPPCSNDNVRCAVRSVFDDGPSTSMSGAACFMNVWKILKSHPIRGCIVFRGGPPIAARLGSFMNFVAAILPPTGLVYSLRFTACPDALRVARPHDNRERCHDKTIHGMDESRSNPSTARE